MLEYIERGGLVGVLVFILIAGWKGLWVYGPTHERAMADLRKDRDEYKERYFSAIKALELHTDNHQTDMAFRSTR